MGKYHKIKIMKNIFYHKYFIRILQRPAVILVPDDSFETA